MENRKTLVNFQNALAKRKITTRLFMRLLSGALRLCLLLGLGFIIIYPFLIKISTMLMTIDDLRDPIVWFIPRNPTMSNIANVIKYGQYWEALRNTTAISLVCAVLQTASTVVTAYGLARFKFKGRGLLLAAAILTIVIPPQTVYLSLYTKFRFFDIFGLFKALGLPALNLVESLTPMVALSVTALGLKNGLYIFILTQMFRGLPRELSEASYIDGAGMLRTFFQVNLPQIKPIMISVFLLSFSWQWTDTFYSDLYFRHMPVMQNVISKARSINGIGAVGNNIVSNTMVNTAVMLIIFPLILLYVFGQRFFIQGVERSGVVG